MIRRVLPLLFLAVRLLPAPEPDIGDFFERFAAEWVRANPQFATFSQYFSGAEQDKPTANCRQDRAIPQRTRDRARGVWLNCAGLTGSGSPIRSACRRACWVAPTQSCKAHGTTLMGTCLIKASAECLAGLYGT
jgi:hypothetical protein